MNHQTNISPNIVNYITKNSNFSKSEIRSTTKHLVHQVQDGIDVDNNLQKIYKLNLRLIFVAHRQYSYGYTLDDIAGYLWDALLTAVRLYDKDSIPFYIYWLNTLRGTLQRTYNYNNGLIHIPVKVRDHVHYPRIEDIDQHLDISYDHDQYSLVHEDNVAKDLIDGYNKLYKSPRDKADLEMWKVWWKNKDRRCKINLQLINPKYKLMLERINKRFRNLYVEV